MKITIIHPSRGRYKQASTTIRNWLSRAKNPDDIEYILSVDTDDCDGYYTECDNQPIYVHVNPNKTAIEAINVAAKEAKGDLLIVVSDDFDCPVHWDGDLLKALKGKTDFLVKTDDGCQPWIITLPILDRVYYDRFGYVYNPSYNHLFCDTEMSHVGALLGRTITLPIKFPHNHYTQRGGQLKDAINDKNDATWAQGEEVYLRNLKNNFGIENPLPIQLPAHHIGWLRSKGIAV